MFEPAAGGTRSSLVKPRVNPTPGHREIWIRDLDGYVVVIASPDGESRQPFPGFALSGAQRGGAADSSMIAAEEKGFEPLVPLRERRFSKPLP
jgi:hypothetical protein